MAITLNISGDVDGTYTLEDNGTPGDGISVLRRPNGTIFSTFANPADALTITTRSGQHIVVNLTDSLTTANFTIGSLTAAAERPSSIQMNFVVTSNIVTLTTSGTITEFGNDLASDILANKLFMLAGTGIAAFNPIETQVAVLEAETTSGPINLTNIGILTIGGLGIGLPALRGLFSGNAGNITLANQGTIFLTDADNLSTVQSAGNVNLSAIGGTADIIANVNQDSISAVGNIFLNAGRDVQFGTSGTNFDNDVRAGGSVFITAGRDFIIDANSDMLANDFGLGTNGGITIAAGQDILIDDANGISASVQVTTGTGSVQLTTGVGGTLELNANSANAVAAGAGGVTVRADLILIEADSGIGVTGGGAVSLTTASAGRGINLGVASDSLFALELSDAELDRISASQLTIGSETSGPMNVIGALTVSGVNNLTLRSGEDMSVNANITTPSTLSLLAADSLFIAGAATLTTNGFTASVDTPDNDSAGGVLTLAGAVVAITEALTGNADNDIIFGNGGDNVLFGFAGNDTLSGAAGIDTTNGGPGNDNHFVDNASDVVTEAVGEGLDSVFTSVSYVLSNASEVERLFSGNPALTTAINLTGNGLDNNIQGNNGDNIMFGVGGNDTILGFGGNDTLNGGTGNDTTNGGLGNDNHFVDDIDDLAIEAVGEGTDSVFTSISYFLREDFEVERLFTTNSAGTDPLTLTGNSLDNNIQGNAGINFIDGKAGNDLLLGFGGADKFLFTTALGATNVDFVSGFETGIDDMVLENLIFTGLAAGPLAAGAFRSGSAAADADDRIIYNPVNGAVLFDVDGVGGTAAVQFATFQPALAITAGDFIVI